MPKVSVIIPAYNCERFIGETIKSVLSQTYQDFEVLVIDDGSEDKTQEIVKGINDPKIVYIHHEENSGVSVARNNAITKSRGEYIALLDHDDLWLPEKLERQVPILESDPKVGLVYSDCYIIDLNGHILGRNFQDHHPHRGEVFPDLFLDNFIPCLTVLIRKDALDRVGLFNPEFSIAEEYDLFLRIAEVYKVDFVDLPLAKYRLHETNFSKNEVRANEEADTVIRTFLGNHPDLKDILGNKVDRRLSTLYYDLGKAYFFKGDKAKSYYCLDKAMRTYKYSFRPLLFKLLTFSGHRFVKKLRELKRGIFLWKIF